MHKGNRVIKKYTISLLTGFLFTNNFSKMNATDQQKLVRAGFTIIRKEIYNANKILRIKTKGSGSHEWKTMEKDFPSIAALERRMNELLKDEKTIED
jgi:hypothetical protein